MVLPVPVTASPPALSAGACWLAYSTASPLAVVHAWIRHGVAEVRVPESWAVAEADLVESLHALPLLARAGREGPVLIHPESQRAWWLVPASAGHHLADLRRVNVRECGATLLCPAPASYGRGRLWLENPDGSGRLTDPVALGAALSGRLRLPARSAAEGSRA